MLSGVSYRGDVGDTRFTPVQGLYELVSMDTKDSIIHDPFVNFWEELGLQVFDSVEPIFEFNPELLIFRQLIQFTNKITLWIKF